MLLCLYFYGNDPLPTCVKGCENSLNKLLLMIHMCAA
uniref:Uncharacterized protein n=1 Tax=Rhizophora mucronata TaxID=61149 RepID=A0A2P2NBQ4_RHIMU